MDSTVIADVLGILSRFLTATSVALIGVYVYDWTTPFSLRTELSEKDNPALGIHLAGYVVALMLTVTGATSGAAGEVSHPIDIAVFGLAAVALLRLGAVCVDRLILRGVPVWPEITRDRNAGVAFVGAGALIATGMILRAALTGESAGLGAGLLTTVEYFAASQVMLVAAAAIYLRWVRYRHPDGRVLGVVEELRDNDNAAVGLAFSGYLIGVSLVVAAGITGTDIETLADLRAVSATLAISSALGVGTMLAARPFVDRAIIPYASMTDEVGAQRNVAVAGLNAAFSVGLGAIIFGIAA